MSNLDRFSYDTLLELYCMAWYLKFKRFPVRQDRLPNKENLIHKIDLLRRHR
jgi:hypothetical protein